jgi:DNA-binding GntR family transcriptional regulator
MTAIKKESLGDLVYEQLRNMLLNKDLVPGQKISKKEIAELLGVSQTPVQESLTRLIREGVLEQRERRGVFVKVFDDKDMRDIFSVRAGLEGIAVRLCMEQCTECLLDDIITIFDEFTLPLDADQFTAYQHADRRFHEQILMRSDNTVILNFLKEFEFIIRCYQKGLLRDPNETLIEHRQIIQAIRDLDIEQAQYLLTHHHLRSRDAISPSNIIR